MLNEDFVQTRKSNSQKPSPDPVLMQQHAEQNTKSSNNNKNTNSDNNEFSYPNSPQPTQITQQPQMTHFENDSSYHATISHSTKRRTRRALMSSVSCPPPPQNRLAFINAVKMAWTLQIKKGKQRSCNIAKKHKSNNKHSHRHQQSHSQHPRRSPHQHAQYPTASMNSGNISIIKNKLDFPPITAEALTELSVSHLFKSLQIRHDLLIDPHLTFRPNMTAEKSHESETYWHRLDYLIKFCATQNEESDDHYQLIFLVRNLLTELSLILTSLISPFPSHPTTSFVWNWPQQISESSIMAVLDPDLVHQQLTQGCLNVDFKFSFLHSILSPLCPGQAEKIQRLVDSQEYARALELCFLTLETIKLDCANKALHYYRPYLIETGTSLEWKVFLKQLDNQEVTISSVSEWLSCTWERLGQDTKFITVFRTGILDLVTNDQDTIAALQHPASPFPITFSYDEKRLTHQMRHEFQNIIVIGLLLMPYRLMAGKKAKQSDLDHLKTTFSKLLKDASIASGRVSCFHLALYACNIAKQLEPDNTTKDNVIDQAKYWSNWMNQNLRNTSPVYQIMYHRVRSMILDAMAQGSFDNVASQHATMGLEYEISKLGQKLILIADYNLRTFGSLYTYLLPSIHHKNQ
ncbi:T-complex protein 11-domain-containing protein [Parasitella parasitica]|nr:T-complex protein 11-domain-containing protein [Parasitella parasitica]